MNGVSEPPENYSEKIVVPFSVETPLSGVCREVKKDDCMHYRKVFSLPDDFLGKRVLLHFEAVDQVADVWVNGELLGHHEGGYLPFDVEFFPRKKENEIVVLVKDDTSSHVFQRGKQSLSSDGIWYTPTSGIWGNVWMEAVPNEAIRRIVINPNYDEKKVSVSIDFDGAITHSKVVVEYHGKTVGTGAFDSKGEVEIDCSNEFHPWSPESPDLYDLRIEANEDSVQSYFGLRKFGKIMHRGKMVFALNDKPYLMKGVLDQGYFPDGGLTAPTDQAMVNDILLMKSMGFNMLRKHIKIEPARWYYHCDRLGMLVIQDFINNGAPYKTFLVAVAPFLPLRFRDNRKKGYERFGQGDKASRDFFEAQLPPVTAHLFNVVSLCTYVLFNEGWGQFDSVRLTGVLRSLDSTRLIDSDCGWYDQGAGDFSGNHIYFRPIHMKHDRKRILTLSEFGGYSERIEGHCFSEKNFGYKLCQTKEALSNDLSKLFREQLGKTIKKQMLSSYVYTQLSDVEQETNGFVTYDREVVKVDIDLMKRLNDEMHW